MRILHVGPGDSATVRGRVGSTLLDEPIERADWVTTAPLPDAFRRRHPKLRQVLLPRPLLRRLPRRLRLPQLGYVAGLHAHVRRFRPDLIHLHAVDPLNALALTGLGRIPLVVSVSESDRSEQDPSLPVGRLARALLRRAAAVTAGSRLLSQRCRELGAPAQRVHLIPCGVETTRFAPSARDAARRSLGLRSAGQLLLSDRALAPRYNHDALLRGVAELGRARGEPPTVLFVRDAREGGYAERIEEQARRLGVPARFLPPLSDDQLPSLYAAADACASLAASDGPPQTLLEALACERPTLALDLPAYRELPFAEDALVRVTHEHGAPRLGSLVAALHTALRPGERPGLPAARTWIEANAERGRSLAALRALYLAIAGC